MTLHSVVWALLVVNKENMQFPNVFYSYLFLFNVQYLNSAQITLLCQ